MQVTKCRVRAGAYTTYSLETVFEDERMVVRYTMPTNTYAALNVEDADSLIESQLWRQLMHKIEHRLRKTAYEQA